MLNNPQYQRLQIESDAAPVPRRSSSELLSWGAGIFTLLLLTAVISAALLVRPHKSNTLEVVPDNSPADKRGAGLLLT